MLRKLICIGPDKRKKYKWEDYSSQYNVRDQKNEIDSPYRPVKAIERLRRRKMIHDIRQQENDRQDDRHIYGSPVCLHIPPFYIVKCDQENNGSYSVDRSVESRQKTKVDSDIQFHLSHHPYQDQHYRGDDPRIDRQFLR